MLIKRDRLGVIWTSFLTKPGVWLACKLPWPLAQAGPAPTPIGSVACKPSVAPSPGQPHSPAVTATLIRHPKPRLAPSPSRDPHPNREHGQPANCRGPSPRPTPSGDPPTPIWGPFRAGQPAPTRAPGLYPI
uniref:Uncharacterized protein n=1 Tax=Myotis myotis TaxID=51298 RepID=A0A7J8AMZ2_MYOMY|nr:hypothetical protein mMyoMyo1_008073 [Myotis myotis]